MHEALLSRSAASLPTFMTSSAPDPNSTDDGCRNHLRPLARRCLAEVRKINAKIFFGVSKRSAPELYASSKVTRIIFRVITLPILAIWGAFVL